MIRDEEQNLRLGLLFIDSWIGGSLLLPPSKPALLIVAIFQFTAIWNDFLVPLIFRRSRKISCWPWVCSSPNERLPKGAPLLEESE